MVFRRMASQSQKVLSPPGFTPSQWGKELDEFTFDFLPRFIARTQPTKHRYSYVFRFGMSTLICLGIFMIKLWFPLLFGSHTPYLLGMMAVVLTTLFGGLGPGLWGTLLFVILVDYYFLPPYGWLMGTESIIQTLMFLLESLFLVILIETQRRTQREIYLFNDALEQRVVVRTQELENANLELQRSNRELDSFAHIASHDLQEPLRKIQAFSDRLLAKAGDNLDQEERDYLYRMQRAAGRMRNLIDDLLKFSRVTTRAQPFELVDLDDVLKDVMTDLEYQIERSGGRVEINDLPVVDADPIQMRQLFQNLISNGLKFYSEGRVPHVKVYMKSSTTAVDDSISIVVQDDGIGFNQKYSERIFNMFERLHGKGVYEGTGIGLTICKKIVERHGGTITVESEENVGTVFTVTLPVNQIKDIQI